MSCFERPTLILMPHFLQWLESLASSLKHLLVEGFFRYRLSGPAYGSFTPLRLSRMPQVERSSSGTAVCPLSFRQNGDLVFSVQVWDGITPWGTAARYDSRVRLRTSGQFQMPATFLLVISEALSRKMGSWLETRTPTTL
jgi:hypothetical protein